MLSRLRRFPAYVSLSRLTIAADSSCIRCKMKFDPINPAPPVTSRLFCMRNVASRQNCNSAARSPLIVNKKGRGSPPSSAAMSLFTVVSAVSSILSRPPFCATALTDCDHPRSGLLLRLLQFLSHHFEVCLLNLLGHLLPLILAVRSASSPFCPRPRAPQDSRSGSAAGRPGPPHSRAGT